MVLFGNDGKQNPQPEVVGIVWRFKDL